jgi:hypothetical protein
MRRQLRTSRHRRLPKHISPRAIGAFVGAVVLALGIASPTSAGSSAKTRVTVIGDSIMGSFEYIPAARRALGKGFDLRTDSLVCRRLVAESCPFQGSTPSTALEVIGTQGVALGSMVVINVGYNDWAAVYDVDRVIRALSSAGVRRVVWVTLREAGPYSSLYAQSNARIRKAAARWKGLVIADWNAYSRGRPWFRTDGLHLTVAGAMGLARFLRPLLVASS